MGFAEKYIFRHSFLLPQIIEPSPLAGLLSFIVVIPAYREDDLTETLESLKNARKPQGDIGVLVIINFSEADSDEIKSNSVKQYRELIEWCKNNSMAHIQFKVILSGNLPKKHAGAGLARKIGMDTALDYFDRNDLPQGQILSLDADTQIEDNYFTAIEREMNLNPGAGGFILKFSHPTAGYQYEPRVYAAIVQYELHLRYYKQILEWIGFPYSRYTVGSCFGVRAGVYACYGGMNRKKAGEDFYFLNKIFPHEEFIDIHSTGVHPSPRPSFRVGFGTGPVVQGLVNSEKAIFQTYNPLAFFDLGILFEKVDELFCISQDSLNTLLSEFSKGLSEFLFGNSFSEKLKEIRENTSTSHSFHKRFFLWFDGFRIVKYLNFVHRKHYSKVPVEQAVEQLLFRKGLKEHPKNWLDMLNLLRKLDEES